MSRMVSDSTYGGYERQDWVDFREKVLDICPVCSPNGLAELLATWQLDGYDGMTAASVAEDMQVIIDHLTPEGSML